MLFSLFLIFIRYQVVAIFSCLPMRLLDTETKRFHQVENPRNVSYAILSHVWSPGKEQSYEQCLKIQAGSSEDQEVQLSPKVRMFCDTARQDGYRYAWLDTACIDQTSSAELSEAINSMYDWYRYADVCYAYLADVGLPNNPDPLSEQFRKSAWFMRGWTLQELIAPNFVVFLSADWQVIGTKHTLAAVIEAVTHIDTPILVHQQSLDTVSVAKRMSWASRRKTTKVEDEAYCLMGIFGVHMPAIYGEGSYAFFRLQEEICKNIPDQSIFAWGGVLNRYAPFHFSAVPGPSGRRLPVRRNTAAAEAVGTRRRYIFAPSPESFKDSFDYRAISPGELAKRLMKTEASYPIFTTTPYGLHARLPLVSASSGSVDMPLFLAFLSCVDGDDRLIALLLRGLSPNDEVSRAEYVVGDVGSVEHAEVIQMVDLRSQSVVTLLSSYFRIAKLSPNDLSKASQHISTTDVHTLARPSRAIYNADRDREIRHTLYRSRGPLRLRLTPWSLSMLLARGYCVKPAQRVPKAYVQPVDASETFTLLPGYPLQLTISDSQGSIVLSIGFCSCQHGQESGLLSVAIVGQREVPCQPIERVASVVHERNDPDHVTSWTHHAGCAAKEFVAILPTPDYSERRLQLSLTRGFASTISTSASQADPGCSPYLMLSIEVREARPVFTENAPPVKRPGGNSRTSGTDTTWPLSWLFRGLNI
ncbi:heterokaryon incompatibility protein-domain-containing protein [Cubamyces lactineus]|nr:heterokaryon incompatibility protein-domain-containing protein [Cubamyces lactineus]